METAVWFPTFQSAQRLWKIPELIESGKTGELFEAGNVEDLMKAIKKVLQTQDVLERYTKNCSQVNYETTESYYVKLMKIYRLLALL